MRPARPATSVSAALAALVVAVAIAACGGTSKADEAQKTTCDARASIGKEVDALKALTPQTFTTSAVSSSLKSIQDDLAKITSAQGDLSDERRQEVESANQAFEAQVKSIAGSLGSTVSLSSASAQLTSALQELAGTYKETFGKISC